MVIADVLLFRIFDAFLVCEDIFVVSESIQFISMLYPSYCMNWHFTSNVYPLIEPLKSGWVLWTWRDFFDFVCLISKIIHDFSYTLPPSAYFLCVTWTKRLDIPSSLQISRWLILCDILMIFIHFSKLNFPVMEFQTTKLKKVKLKYSKDHTLAIYSCLVHLILVWSIYSCFGPFI